MDVVPTTAGDTRTKDLGAVYMHEHVFVRAEPCQWGWPGFGKWHADAEVEAAGARPGNAPQTLPEDRTGSRGTGWSVDGGWWRTGPVSPLHASQTPRRQRGAD
jgi:hypothetical protein